MENPAPQQVSPLPNQQWEWVIVDLEDGSVSGTNEHADATHAASSELFVVINVKTNQVLDQACNYNNIPEI